MTGTIVIKKLTTLASTSATYLRRIGGPVWRVMTFSPSDDIISPKKALCVSIEKGALSVVFGSRLLSKIKIKGSRRYSFEENRYPQPEGLASSVALAVNDLGAARTDVTLSIPKAWVIIKNTEFPSTVKENLVNVLSYELDRLTPFNPEDSLYDFRILKDDAGKLTILVMAAKADLIKQYIDALRERGINVSRVTVSLSGIGTLCHYIDKVTDSIFVEIDENEYEGALFLDGSITVTSMGSFTAESEKSKVEKISGEILSLLDTAKKQDRSPQITVLLKDTNSSFKELLKLQINQPVKMLNETDIKLRPPGPQKRVFYAATGGVLESLWPKAKGLNLLKKGLYEKQKTPFVFTVVLILTILVLGILYMVAPLRIEKKKLEEIDRQITLRKEEVKKVETLKKDIENLNNEVSSINNFKGNRPMALNILRELTTTLPQSTWLTRMRITETTADIEGYASSATGLLPKLEASKYFRKAEFASPTFRDARQNADRFIIKMEIEGVKKETPEKAAGAAEEDDDED
jgi:general secretion pathway protein L